MCRLCICLRAIYNGSGGNPAGKSGFSKIEYNAGDGVWTLTATQNDFGDTRPTVQCKPLTQELHKDYIVVAFDYKSDRAVGNFRITVNKAGRNAIALM